MILSKFSVHTLHLALIMHEGKTGMPIYAISYRSVDKDKPLFVHHSISYTREQAFHIYESFVLYLTWRYLHLLPIQYPKIY